jgi:C-methyltransferase
VLPVARAQAERLGVLDRAEFVAGDMFDATLGGPYDLAVLSQVLHHFSAAKGGQLLERVASCLRPDGRVVVHDFVAGVAPPAAEPAPHLFSVLLTAWTREGEAHTLAAFREMLAAAGFAEPSVHHLPGLPTRALVADRAAG